MSEDIPPNQPKSNLTSANYSNNISLHSEPPQTAQDVDIQEILKFNPKPTLKSDDRSQNLNRHLKQVTLQEDDNFLYDNVFQEDDFLLKKNSKIIQRVITKIDRNRFEETNIIINIGRYVEFLVYHLLYFTILGPLMIIPMSIFPGMGYYLGVNMQFYGRWSSAVLIQGITWINNVMALYGFYFQGWGYFLTKPIIMSIFMSNFMRSTNIAGKYSTFNDTQVKEYKNEKLSIESINKELMIAEWSTQRIPVVYKSMNQAANMEGVEGSTSFITFMRPVKPETKKRLTEIGNICEEMKTRGSTFTKVETDKITDLQCDVQIKECPSNKLTEMQSLKDKSSPPKFHSRDSSANFPKVIDERKKGDIDLNQIEIYNMTDRIGSSRLNSKETTKKGSVQTKDSRTRQILKPKNISFKNAPKSEKPNFVFQSDTLKKEIISMFAQKANSFIMLDVGLENPHRLDFYPLEDIMFYLINECNKRIETKGWIYFSIFLGLFRGFIPPNLVFDFTQSFPVSLVLFPANGFMENMTYFMLCLNTAMFYFLTATFSKQAVVDLQRKNALLQQLTQMIKAEKTLSIPKVLPTISLLDVASVYSWLKMRKVAKSYGNKFFKRHELYLAVIFLLMIFLLVVFVLAHFDFILILSKETKLQFKSVIISDFLIASLFSVSIMFFSARLNGYYDTHIYEFIKVKETVQEIYRFREHFFDLEPENYSIIHLQKSQVFKEKIENPVFKAYVDTIKRICPKNDIPEYLNNLLETYEHLIETLQNEKEYDQLKVLGLTISMEFFINVLVGTMSGAVAGVQILFFPEG